MQSAFLEDHILAHMGCCAPQILHMLESYPSLASTPPTGHWGPPYNFLKGVTNWRKFWHICACNLPTWNFVTWRAIRWALSLRYTFWRACTPEIWDGQKVKNLAWFRTTFKFDRKYLRKWSGYQKSEMNLIDNDPCWVQQKSLVNFGAQT